MVSPSDDDPTQQYLAELHRGHATATIVGSDAAGAFLESPLDWLLGDALPAVVDANVLRNDIGYACRSGRRTAMLSAANSRIFRLYCAQHVYDEVEEHAAEWAASMKLESEAFLTMWRENYVPLLRLARTEGMENQLLAEERDRVERLRVVLDIDDVPSAVLALTMGAFFVSEDAAPHETVHGRKLSAEDRRAWLPILRAGADSAELQRLVSVTAAIPMLFTIGGFSLARSLWARSPAFLLGPALVALFLATRVPRERYQMVWREVVTTASVFYAQLYRPQSEALDRFRSALPAFPSWDDLIEELPRDAALARACLYRLARSRGSPLTARELADDLPALGIGQAPQRVGRVLRQYDCFFEPYRGHWQLGAPIQRFQ